MALETYSVLTRLPGGQRVPPAAALGYLQDAYRFHPITLRPSAYEEMLGRLVNRRIQGGAVYDALVGPTGRQEEATLLTLDHRAVETYEVLGVQYRLV